MEDHKTIFRRLKDQVDKSSYQKDLHFGNENEETSIRTQFLNMKRKETWSYRTNLKMDCVGDISNPNFITYKVRVLPFHALRYTIAIQQLPSITAKPGYEISWCPNIGSNIIQNTCFKVNDVEWQSLNSEYFDDYISKIDTSSDLDWELGNIPELQNWNTSLPSYTTLFKIPWFYSSHTTKSFPLFKCGKEDNIVIESKLRRNLSELLRVRDVATQKEVGFDESYITVSSPSILPVPEFRSDYVQMSDMECEHNRCDESKNKYSNHIYDIDNVKMVESDNIHVLNTTVNIKIKDMPFPVHTIHWKAVNLDAKNNNYLSNYSTSAEEHTLGGSPIKWISLSTPNGIIFKNQDAYIGEKIIPKMHFNKVPKYPGYGCWTNATDACDVLYPKSGINLNDSELTFRLENNDFPSGCNFRIVIQLVYTYRITIKDYPKTEAERNVKGMDFDISGDM
jgi:hypothetical protein